MKTVIAMNMIAEREANGSFFETPLASLIDAIAHWKSPISSIDDVCKL